MSPLHLLTGQELEFIRLGHAIVLGFSGDRHVIIESAAHLAGPGGRAEVGPDDPSDAIGTLLGDVVRQARAGESGELRIAFASGAELLVDADADAESWAVTGPDGFLIVCLARGELAMWGGAAA
ncbi:DUF6188 family protein [Actinoplanes sp. NPDC023936]|uniref:DUF6188 family protein n=1 Tax=Actinoplanes sp. NPDC023936 TaxID=3154910 RepID=UPI00340F1F09